MKLKAKQSEDLEVEPSCSYIVHEDEHDHILSKIRITITIVLLTQRNPDVFALLDLGHVEAGGGGHKGDKQPGVDRALQSLVGRRELRERARHLDLLNYSNYHYHYFSQRNEYYDYRPLLDFYLVLTLSQTHQATPGVVWE